MNIRSIIAVIILIGIVVAGFYVLGLGSVLSLTGASITNAPSGESCSALCEQSCSDFSGGEHDQCIAECAQFCSNGY